MPVIYCKAVKNQSSTFSFPTAARVNPNYCWLFDSFVVLPYSTIACGNLCSKWILILKFLTPGFSHQLGMVKILLISLLHTGGYYPTVCCCHKNQNLQKFLCVAELMSSQNSCCGNLHPVMSISPACNHLFLWCNFSSNKIKGSKFF